MAGHSKWAKIKRGKAITDAKRSNLFAKLSKEIMVAVKLGGSDPGANARLRFAIEKAKINQFPANNIERAIQKGSGVGADSDNIEEIIYEGYGPGGTAILISCTTDNKNRTVKDIRSYFTKCSGNLAQSGAVAWMFNKLGEIKIKKESFSSQEEIYEICIEAGAIDIDFSDEDIVLVLTEPEELEKVQKTVSEKASIEEYNLTYRPKETLNIDDIEKATMLVKLLDMIEDQEDVQEVFSNFDISDEILETISQCQQ